MNSRRLPHAKRWLLAAAAGAAMAGCFVRKYDKVESLGDDVGGAAGTGGAPLGGAAGAPTEAGGAGSGGASAAGAAGRAGALATAGSAGSGGSAGGGGESGVLVAGAAGAAGAAGQAGSAGDASAGAGGIQAGGAGNGGEGGATVAGAAGVSGAAGTAGAAGGEGGSAGVGSPGGAGGLAGGAGSAGSAGSAGRGGQGGAAGSYTLGVGKVIIPDRTGWVGMETNEVGVQGQWYTLADDYSYIYPDPGPLSSDGSGELCADGWVDWIGDNWGALVGFDLCQNSDTQEPPGALHPIGSCPWNPNMVAELTGISFTITSPYVTGMWVVFAESGRTENAYVPITVDTGSWEYSARMADAVGDPVNPEQVESIYFMIPASAGYRDFSFCISGITLLP